MADNDIYDNQKKYERFKEDYIRYLEPPEGKRKYQIKYHRNTRYIEQLIQRFEATDISFIRRLRLLRSFLIVCHSIDKDLSRATREDIDKMICFSHTRNRSIGSKSNFLTDLKHMWKIILPEKDERGRPDETIVPYVVRHLSSKIDKSKEKMRRDRLTMAEYESLIASFGNDARMQALISIKVDTLGRPQELLGRNIEDVELYDNYAKIYITEHGKEGVGFLGCIESYYYLSKWLNQHPLRNDQKAPLFINLGQRNKYQRMRPEGANKLIRERCKVLGIDKPITLYSFKRNGVTYCRLRGDSDVEIQHKARWTSTRQLKTYDMSDQDDAFRLELIKRGKVKPDKRFPGVVPLVKHCPFCNFESGIADKFCSNCNRPLDRSTIEEEEKEKLQENRRLKEEIEAIKTQQKEMMKNDDAIREFLLGIIKEGKVEDLKRWTKESGLLPRLMKLIP